MDVSAQGFQLKEQAKKDIDRSRRWNMISTYQNLHSQERDTKCVKSRVSQEIRNISGLPRSCRRRLALDTVTVSLVELKTVIEI